MRNRAIYETGAERLRREADRNRAEAERERQEKQARLDAETVFITVATNTRTGNAIRRNSRDSGLATYLTEDGDFIALAEEADAMIDKWRNADELSEKVSTISGRALRLALEKP